MHWFFLDLVFVFISHKFITIELKPRAKGPFKLIEAQTT